MLTRSERPIIIHIKNILIGRPYERGLYARCNLAHTTAPAKLPVTVVRQTMTGFNGSISEEITGEGYDVRTKLIHMNLPRARVSFHTNKITLSRRMYSTIVISLQANPAPTVRNFCLR